MVSQRQQTIWETMSDTLSIDQIDSITVYTFHDSTEAAIDVWADDAALLIDAATDEGFHILMDVSQKQVNFSSYARQKSKELFTRYRTKKGRYAFLFSSPTAPYYSRIFFASLGRLNFEFGYFTDREKALKWLREELPQR